MPNDVCCKCGVAVNLLWTNVGWVCFPCFKKNRPDCLADTGRKPEPPDYSETGNENARQW